MIAHVSVLLYVRLDMHSFPGVIGLLSGKELSIAIFIFRV